MSRKQGKTAIEAGKEFASIVAKILEAKNNQIVNLKRENLELKKKLNLQNVNSRLMRLFKTEWIKRRRMHFDWEWVEDTGCINEIECRRMVKSILKQLKNGC